MSRMQTRWSGSIVKLRKTISQGLTEKTISDEFFVFELLKALCDDSVDEHSKCQILYFLEEHCALLLNTDSIEQVMASLLDIYQQRSQRGTDVPNICTGQLLITLTTITIEFNQLEQDAASVTRFLYVLFDLVCKTNNMKRSQIRGQACQCLRELEAAYPCLLVRRLNLLYSLMKEELTYIYQDYVALFSLVMLNAVTQLDQNASCGLVDSQLPETPIDRRDVIKFPCAGTLSDKQESGEVLQAISHMMEHMYAFTTPALMGIILSVIPIIEQTPGLSESVFKPLILQHMSTSDVPMLQLMLHLKHTFPGTLLSDSEDRLLLHHIVTCVNHPSFSAGLRLLFFHWLLHFDGKSEEEIIEEEHLPVKLSTKLYKHFYPKVFDGVDTQVQKIQVLSLCYKRAANSDRYSSVLMGCMRGLHKTVQYSGTGKAATGLMRVLFHFYTHHRHTELLHHIKEFLVKLVSSCPYLVPHTINFLSSVTAITPDSEVQLDLLSALHSQVLSTPVHLMTSQLDFVLQVLRKAASEKLISPKPTLDMLEQMLSQAPQLQSGSWSYGNAVLGVARALLLTHSTDMLYTELGSLYHTMLTRYGDVDIRDKARFCYSLLTGTSDEKIHTVLDDRTKDGAANASHSLNTIVGDASTFIKQSLVQLNKSPLVFTRLSQRFVWYPSEPLLDSCLDEDGRLNMDKYFDTLKKHEISLQIKYQVKLDDEEEEEEEKEQPLFDHVYAVTISLQQDQSNYKEVEDATVASLKDLDTVEVDVEIQPVIPLAVSFTTRAMFTGNNKRTYSCFLDPVQVAFTELFMCLPLRQSHTQCLNNNDIFVKLWNHMLQQCPQESNEEQSQKCTESVYVISHPLKVVRKQVKNSLSTYIITPEQDNEICVGIFLPPYYHLLMRLSENEDSAVIVHSMMDQWRILNVLQDFLHKLCPSYES